VEIFRLKANYQFLHFCVIGKVVQGNGEDLIKWDECQEFIEVILEITLSFVRNITKRNSDSFLQI
jgi:hypothetical protein